MSEFNLEQKLINCSKSFFVVYFEYFAAHFDADGKPNRKLDFSAIEPKVDNESTRRGAIKSIFENKAVIAALESCRDAKGNLDSNETGWSGEYVKAKAKHLLDNYPHSQ